MTTPETENRVLDMWASEKKPSVSIIAKRLGLASRSAASGVIYRARAKGDPRAAKRADVAPVRTAKRGTDAGMVYKLKLIAERAAQAAARKAATLSPASPDAPALPVEEPAPVLREDAFRPLPGADPIGLMDLRDTTCRWPVGEVPWRFCGCRCEAEKAYCEAHARMATRKPYPAEERLLAAGRRASSRPKISRAFVVEVL